MNSCIIIADDHPIFRSGVSGILHNVAGITLAGEAANGLEAYQLILSARPDIAILDLDMPGLNGLDVCRKVMSEKHVTRFIILTMHKDRHYFDEAMEAGVLGYLLKDNAIDELLACISAVSKGERYVSKQIDSYLTGHSTRDGMPESVKALYKELTATEKVIVKLISCSYTSKDIADNLFISPNTVENHRANIARKLKLEGKNSLLKFALQYKDVV